MTTLITIVVVAVLAVIFLPKILKGGLLGGLGGAQASAGGNGGLQVATGNGGGSYDVDVSGNGCACANGHCKGNCSDMEQIDLANFDPLEYVQQHT